MTAAEEAEELAIERWRALSPVQHECAVLALQGLVRQCDRQILDIGLDAPNVLAMVRAERTSAVVAIGLLRALPSARTGP